MVEAEHIEFGIAAHGEDAETLRGVLAAITAEHVGLELRISSPFRGVDPAGLVAVVTVIGTVVGALVTGLLQIAQSRQATTIVLSGKDGSRLEIPSDLPTR